jgi:hypothetical protein
MGSCSEVYKNTPDTATTAYVISNVNGDDGSVRFWREQIAAR